MARHPDYEREELLTQAVMCVAELKGWFSGAGFPGFERRSGGFACAILPGNNETDIAEKNSPAGSDRGADGENARQNAQGAG